MLKILPSKFVSEQLAIFSHSDTRDDLCSPFLDPMAPPQSPDGPARFPQRCNGAVDGFN